MNMSREEFLSTINFEHADRLGVSEVKKEMMIEIYSNLWSVLKRPDMFASTGDDAVIQVRSLEYILQTLWGFERDARYHRYHFEIKGCTCPYMDNREVYGTVLEYHNDDCPFHGNNKHEKL
jgi:hypothetical protein